MVEISGVGAPRRSPDGGGYPRGVETRARIVAAALQVFGEEGYLRASTRQIADAAGVNPPALQYYFDSKEGLHRACAHFIIDRVSQTLSPALAAADEALVAGDKGLVMEALCDILDVLADVCLNTDDVAGWSRFMGRGQIDDAGPAYALIRDGIKHPLRDTVSRLISPLIGREPDDDETRLRTIFVLSPLLSLNVNRADTLADLAWPDFGDGRRDQVKAYLRAHTRAALGAAGSS
jgi:AcrR family transcriptional regulator